jgi:hypothetical protein
MFGNTFVRRVIVTFFAAPKMPREATSLANFRHEAFTTAGKRPVAEN